MQPWAAVLFWLRLDGQDGMDMHSGFNRDKAYDNGKKNIKKS
jgi:hypothetical protein